MLISPPVSRKLAYTGVWVEIRADADVPPDSNESMDSPSLQSPGQDRRVVLQLLQELLRAVVHDVIGGFRPHVLGGPPEGTRELAEVHVTSRSRSPAP